MRVFILGTGRTGSMTFSRACSHFDNYTSGHESRAGELAGRFDYPLNHIEADNRLSWFLNSLGQRLPDARYVHLLRNAECVVESFRRRFVDGSPRSHRLLRGVRQSLQDSHSRSIIDSFGHSILTRDRVWSTTEQQEVARLYVQTVRDAIEAFLIDRPHMTIDIDDASRVFPSFCRWIAAEGDMTAAVAEFSILHNASSD